MSGIKNGSEIIVEIEHSLMDEGLERGTQGFSSEAYIHLRNFIEKMVVIPEEKWQEIEALTKSLESALEVEIVYIKSLKEKLQKIRC